MNENNTNLGLNGLISEISRLTGYVNEIPSVFPVLHPCGRVVIGTMCDPFSLKCPNGYYYQPQYGIITNEGNTPGACESFELYLLKSSSNI